MKRVSLKVAKYLKDAGYPQGNTKMVWSLNHYVDPMNPQAIIPEGVLVEQSWNDLISVADAPTYLEVWLWLWQTKKISIDIDYLHGIFWGAHTYGDYVKNKDGEPEFSDLEEALITAIEYLVDNELFK